jgi:hypothetical protein
MIKKYLYSYNIVIIKLILKCVFTKCTDSYIKCTGRKLKNGGEAGSNSNQTMNRVL